MLASFSSSQLESQTPTQGNPPDSINNGYALAATGRSIRREPGGPVNNRNTPWATAGLSEKAGPSQIGPTTGLTRSNGWRQKAGSPIFNRRSRRTTPFCTPGSSWPHRRFSPAISIRPNSRFANISAAIYAAVPAISSLSMPPCPQRKIGGAGRKMPRGDLCGRDRFVLALSVH